MLLSQGRFWRASLTKDADAVVLALLRDSLPEDLAGLRELRIEVPLARWGLVVKHARRDRRLLGGALLDHTRQQDQLSAALAEDDLLCELQRVVADATLSLIEDERVMLGPPVEEAGTER
jgi:hypothetical protein